MTIFKKSELKSKYSVKYEIGRGNFAEVRLAVNRETKEKVAVKIVRVQDDEDYKNIKQEVEILGRLKHKNIIRLHEIFESKDKFNKSVKKVYIVMELVTGGELFDRIVDRKTLKENEARDVIRTVLDALEYMHANGVVHRDLKPENILMAHPGPDSPIKIADFGLSKLYDHETRDNLQTMCGTPGYVAPEVLRKRGYGTAVDMWSLGIVTYIMLCGFPPFYEESREKLFRRIVKGAFDFPSPYWDDISPEAMDFIRKLLVTDPRNRMTPAECRRHKWMQADIAHIDSGISTAKLRAYQDGVRAKKRWRKVKTTIVAAKRFQNAIANKMSFGSEGQLHMDPAVESYESQMSGDDDMENNPALAQAQTS